MNLSRASLAKVYLSFHLEWLNDSRFSKSNDGGVIYLQLMPYSPGHGQAIYAVGQGKVAFEKVGDIRDYVVYLVLPCDIISASLFSQLEEMDIRWQQSGVATRIEVVADMGKDPSGEMKYSYCGFDDVDMFIEAIKKGVITQGEQTDLNLDSVASFKMRKAFREYLAKYVADNHRDSVTLRQVNKKLREHLKTS